MRPILTATHYFQRGALTNHKKIKEHERQRLIDLSLSFVKQQKICIRVCVSIHVNINSTLFLLPLMSAHIFSLVLPVKILNL